MPTSEDLPTGRMAWRVDEGDALDLLARVPADSIDAFVDDPPAGISFMGRAWDDKRAYEPSTERGHEILNGLDLLGLPRWQSGFVCFMAEVAAEKLRVAKPGAHSLSWALPRTTDLTTLALRLAGWEIRDSIVHLFGGGFPKSHDVSKALDKAVRAEREVLGTQPCSGNRGSMRGSALHLANAKDGKLLDGRSADKAADYRARESYDITAPSTDLAKQWDGWGTALSPAHENWILARKPMGQTVAANVTEWGTGGLNIDATRTGTTKDVPASPPRDRINQPSKGDERGRTANTSGFNPNVGRWPKNAIFSCPLACTSDNLVGDGGDEPARERSEGGASRYFPRFHNHAPGCPVVELDRQSGHQISGTAVKRNLGEDGASQRVDVKARTQRGADVTFADSGGASRFFPKFGYHPKASDRSVPGRPDLTNAHPTHKNPDLMRWLVRLITPPGGLVLDWCCGSGTTGVACMAEGVRFLGLERDADHVEVARARIGAPVQVGLF